MLRKSIFAALASAMVFAVPAHAEGDAAAGAKVYNQCKACHDIEKGVNRVGPTMKGVFGRKAAAIADYKYSEAMIAKGAEGVVWDDANLTAYLTSPKTFVPKGKMAFAGLKKPDDLANVIAYLKANP
jgi:cytochrome c